MTARLILKYPDQRLRIESETVKPDDWNGKLQEWCQDLQDTMVVNSGLGLAAPQVNIQKRLFAVSSKELDNPDIFQQNYKDDVIFFINPSIKFLEKETSKSLEACLSVPGTIFSIKRSPAIELTFTTLNQQKITVEVVGEDAVVLQHEYDHLQGKLFVDKLNPFDRKNFLKKFEKLKRQKTDGELNQIREMKRAAARSKRKR